MIFAQYNRLEPELANKSFTLNVNVSRFLAVKAVKEEPITPLDKCGGHGHYPDRSDRYLQSRCSTSNSIIPH